MTFRKNGSGRFGVISTAKSRKSSGEFSMTGNPLGEQYMDVWLPDRADRKNGIKKVGRYEGLKDRATGGRPRG